MSSRKPFEQKMLDGWIEKRKHKEETRKANREAWAARRDWSDDRFQKPEINFQPQENTEPSSSPALTHLRAIVADPQITLYRRLNAAEVVLNFELGPGAAIGVNPDTIAAQSYQFLRAVVDAQDTPEAQRFRALKLVANVENARASAKGADLDNSAKRQLLIALVNAQRARKLRLSAQWNQTVQSRADWTLKDTDQLQWPNGWPGTWKWPPDHFSNALQNADCSKLVDELQQ
jgi:hypothetical protein